MEIDRVCEQFIIDAYRGILKRDPDEDALCRAKSILSAGYAREQFLRGLVESREFETGYLQGHGIITEDITHDTRFLELYEKCREFTITSLERMYALYAAVKYLVQEGVPGDIVECGVWKGGSCMLAAYTLLSLGDTERRIYLYDTFTGMTEPRGEDVRFDGAKASSLWPEYHGQCNESQWWNCGVHEVRQNLCATGYPADKLVFVEGSVERTIPGIMPAEVALLRLDTDWYASTWHELTHLYPRLPAGGVLVIDDYGWWSGSRQATDRYLTEHNITMLLSRIDSCGARMGVKMRA